MELITALVAPILGGVISFGIWQSKRNSMGIHESLNSLHSCVHEIDKKVDEVQIDIAKNYCTKDELKGHVEQEESWHDKFSQDLTDMKDMQWKIRMDQLEIKGRLDKGS